MYIHDLWPKVYDICRNKAIFKTLLMFVAYSNPSRNMKFRFGITYCMEAHLLYIFPHFITLYKFNLYPLHIVDLP